MYEIATRTKKTYRDKETQMRERKRKKQRAGGRERVERTFVRK